MSVLSAEQADRRDAGGPLLQEQPKGTWSRSWDKLHRHLMPNALRLLPGSSVEVRGRSGAPRPRVPKRQRVAGAGGSPRSAGARHHCQLP